MNRHELPARGGGEVGFPPPTTWPDQPVVTYDPVGSDQDEESGLDVSRLVAGVLRFKWLVVLTTILGAVAGGGRLVPNRPRVRRSRVSLDPGFRPGSRSESGSDHRESATQLFFLDRAPQVLRSADPGGHR